MASSIFGFIIIVATGFLQLTKSQENWTSYRSTAELLQSEYHLFKINAGDYSYEKIGMIIEKENNYLSIELRQ